MSWRTIIISQSAKLDYQMGYMVVRRETVVKIHISEIYMLLIETLAVSLTAALLLELTKRKVKVILCDEKRNPSSELLPYYGSHDTSQKIKKQIAWDKDVKTAVWTEIVSEKIRQQAALLEECGLKESEMLHQYLKELRYGDTSNREGHAAKVYFNALFGMDFTRGEDNATNAALNYGYSIILSCFTREIAANGYITQLGLFHDNMYNPFNLASDLMEPYRPLVDRIVKKKNLDTFEHDDKIDMLRLLDEEIWINNRREYVSNAIKIYTKSVFDALNDQDISLIRFYRYEL